MSRANSMPRTPAVIDINLLPSMHRRGEVSVGAIVVGAVMLVAIVAAAPLSLRALDARSDANAMQSLSERAERDLHGIQTDVAAQRALHVQLDDANRQLRELRQHRAQIQGGARPLGEDLAMLWGWGYLPAGARITAVTGTQTGFKVEGIAAGPLDAISYASKLAQAGFANARLLSFVPGPKDGGQFTLEVTR
jgi:hypothetical protein